MANRLRQLAKYRHYTHNGIVKGSMSTGFASPTRRLNAAEQILHALRLTQGLAFAVQDGMYRWGHGDAYKSDS